MDYYTRLERGNLGGASDTVLNSVATVLQLDEAERAHLFDLARATQAPRRSHRKPAAAPVRPSIQPERPVNLVRFVFLNPRSQDFFIGWNQYADDAVAILRTAAGRDPYDDRLSHLVGELCTRSDDSGPAGDPTTCASTAPASRRCGTPTSANSISPTRGWSFPPTPD